MNYNLQCPKCGKKFILRVNNEQSLLQNNFICNKCGFSTPFCNMLPHLASLMEQTGNNNGSQNGGKPSDGLHTKISNARTDADTDPNFGHTKVQPGPAKALPIYFEVEGQGRKIPLTPGSHTLGRDSNDTKATIKVAADPYMSRSHARLDVNVNGSSVKVSLTPLKSNNDVLINDKPVATGTGSTLKLGDRVLLGKTTIVLKINK